MRVSKWKLPANILIQTTTNYNAMQCWQEMPHQHTHAERRVHYFVYICKSILYTTFSHWVQLFWKQIYSFNEIKFKTFKFFDKLSEQLSPISRLQNCGDMIRQMYGVCAARCGCMSMSVCCMCVVCECAVHRCSNNGPSQTTPIHPEVLKTDSTI